MRPPPDPSTTATTTSPRQFLRFAGLAGAGWLLDATLLLTLVALGIDARPANVASSCTAALTVFLWSGLYRFQMVAAGVPAAEFLPMLLTRADALAAGVIAGALWFHVAGTGRYSRILEATPLALLLLLLVCVLVLPRKDWEFTIYHSLLAIGAAAYILRAAVAASEMKWLEAGWLRFMGDNSYSIYLIHMPVAGIVHHLTTGSPPGISTPLQWLATALATIATLALGRVLTRLVEEPLTALGRQFHWAKPEARPQPTIA